MLRSVLYADTQGRSYTGGELDAAVQHGTPTSKLAVSGRWERASEPLEDIPDQVKRDWSAAALTSQHETRDARWTGGLAWNRLNYREETPYFGKDERDYQHWTASGGYLVLGARESLAGIEAEASDLRRSSDASANPYRSGQLLGRWRHAIGQRSAVDLRLGASLRLSTDYTAGDPANDDKRLLSPVANLRLVWGWADNSWLILVLASKPAEGISAVANASRDDSIQLWDRIPLLDRLDLVGFAWALRRVDSGEAPGLPILSYRDVFVRQGLEYRLRDGLGLRTWAAWQRRLPDQGAGYSRALVALELAAAL